MRLRECVKSTDLAGNRGIGAQRQRIEPGFLDTRAEPRSQGDCELVRPCQPEGLFASSRGWSEASSPSDTPGCGERIEAARRAARWYRRFMVFTLTKALVQVAFATRRQFSRSCARAASVRLAPRAALRAAFVHRQPTGGVTRRDASLHPRLLTSSPSGWAGFDHPMSGRGTKR